MHLRLFAVDGISQVLLEIAVNGHAFEIGHIVIEDEYASRIAGWKLKAVTGWIAHRDIPNEDPSGSLRFLPAFWRLFHA